MFASKVAPPLSTVVPGGTTKVERIGAFFGNLKNAFAPRESIFFGDFEKTNRGAMA